MKIKAIILPHQKSKNNDYPVQIRVNTGESKKFFPIGANVFIHEWDVKNGLVNDKRKNYAEINLKILTTITEIEKNYLAGAIPEPGNKNDFYWWFEKLIKQSEGKHSKFYVKNRQTSMNKLKAFRNPLRVTEVTYDFLLNYENHLRTTLTIKKRPHEHSFIMDQFARIKAVMTAVTKSGVIEYKNNPFNHFKITQRPKEKTRPPADALIKLFKIETEDKKIILARDLFVFSFFCRGIRWGDMCRLKRTDRTGNYLKYKTNKTGQLRNIELSEIAICIIERQPRNKGGYIFDTGINCEKEELSINEKNKIFNKYLWKACRLAEIPKLTYHLSRNLLTDQLIKEKTNLKAIQEALGHARISTTQNYTKAFYPEETNDALNNVYNKISLE